MYEFIVLGLVPGTDVQISFEMWLRVAAFLIIAILTRRIIRAVFGVPETHFRYAVPNRRQV